MDILSNSETLFRLSFFLGALVILAIYELVAPRRVLERSRGVRWYSNLGISAFNSIIVNIIFPLMPVGLAVIVNERGWGIFHFYEVQSELVIVISIVILDLAIYFQHVLVHAVPVFWRFHRMHHADQDFDVTTGARFHPVEIILSMAIKMAVIILFGIPALAVLIFEVLLNATSMFNHSNIKLPIAFDKVLRFFLVTPDMHRVHHSILPSETNTNFGFNLPWWDHLFGTYKAQPRFGHANMVIGIDIFRSSHDLHLHRMLIQPIISDIKDYSIKRGERNK